MNKKEEIVEALEGRRKIKCEKCGETIFKKTMVENVEVWESKEMIEDDYIGVLSVDYKCSACGKVCDYLEE